MKPSSPPPYYYDDRREVSFLITMAAFWIVLLLFLVLRDPLWRLFYEGQLVSTSQVQQSGWMGLDETLISSLTKVDVSPRAGNDKLEEELVEALKQRLASEAALQSVTATPQVAPDGKLRDIARARAQARGQNYLSGQERAPELVYPEIYLALARPDRLLRVVEAAQPLAVTPTAGSTIPAELVGGWMNNLSFANIIQNPSNLELGVGVTPMPSGGGSSVVVLLVQSFVQLDSSLPSVINKDTPLQLNGRRLSTDEVTFYFKGPQDPSFAPLTVQWAGDQFSATVPWSQGPGIYALRARKLDRLSDPRPILVK
jgi:hypothetical protein